MLAIILSLFPDKLKQFIKTEAQMLDSVDYIIFILVKNRICDLETSRLYLLLRNTRMTALCNVTKSVVY